MKSRIKQYAPDMPEYIDLDECALSAPLQDKYQGAGAAIIVCAGDTILDIEYIKDIEQASEVWGTAILSGCDVYFGMCSCVQLCYPLDLSEAQGNDQAVADMIAHAKKHKFMGYR